MQGLKMADWAKFLNDFLTLSNYPILQNKGKLSALEAKLKAEGEYEIYRQRQDADYISNFDRVIKRIEGKGKARVACCVVLSNAHFPQQPICPQPRP